MTKKTECVYASKAIVGMHYVTKGGNPVTILEHLADKKQTKVKADLTGRVVLIDDAQLLWPYTKERVSKEAIALAKVQAAGKSEPKPRVKKTWIGKLIERVYKGKTLKVTVKDDGFLFEGKPWTSLSALAKHITNRPEVDGPRFFGLRKAS